MQPAVFEASLPGNRSGLTSIEAQSAKELDVDQRSWIK